MHYPLICLDIHTIAMNKKMSSCNRVKKPKCFVLCYHGNNTFHDSYEIYHKMCSCICVNAFYSCCLRVWRFYMTHTWSHWSELTKYHLMKDSKSYNCDTASVFMYYHYMLSSSHTWNIDETMQYCYNSYLIEEELIAF